MTCKRFLPYTFLFFIHIHAYSQIKKEHIKSIENQYAADLGNGTFLNPVLKGNYADPSVVRDGEDYYMTHSSFDNIPGLLIWHSKDLVNWEPIANALKEYVGGVWAPDIIKYKNTFYIYFPAGGKNWVVTATNPAGPWSKPVDHHSCSTNNTAFPVSSNQKMNAYLKEIADVCNIHKDLTFHIARHTFATTVTLLNGVPIESVSKMLGHTNIKTTQHYAKILDIKVGADMALLRDKFAIE